MSSDYRDKIDYGKLIALTRDERVDPDHLRDARYDDAAAAFQRMDRGDFVLTQRQVHCVRDFETALSGSCPSCGLFQAGGRHARGDDETGRIVWECHLKRALDLLPTIYSVLVQAPGGTVAARATTWKVSERARGIEYDLLSTTMPRPPVPTSPDPRVEIQLLAAGRAASTWEPDPRSSEIAQIRQELSRAFHASQVSVKLL